MKSAVKLFLILTVCSTLLAGDEWRKKPASEWTDEEVKQILTDSPWAKQVKVRYLEGPSMRGGGGQAPMPGPFPGGGTPPIGVPGGNPGGGTPGGGRGIRTASEVLVQWQSASVVRQAMKKAGAHEAFDSQMAERSYVIAVAGIPEMDDRFDPDDPRVEERVRDSSRLLVGNNRSLIPDRVRAVREDQGITVLYFFDKTKVGEVAGEKLKLMARVGPAQFSAEFKTKDMQFEGKPDL